LCTADSIALDISAGFGRNKPFFAHAQYVAIDLEVSKGWDFSGLDLIGDALNLPIKDNSVDLILSSSSLEHYSNPFKAFEQFARVLKPGGSLFLDVPFSYVEHQIPHDYFRVSRYGLNHLCKQHGLEAVSIEPDCGGPVGSLRTFLEVLEFVSSVTDKDSEDHKVFEDTLKQLKGTLKPIFDRIDCQHLKSGVGDDIQNCSQFPVRYNLVATKPGKLGKPKHYKDRAALLQDIAECPACHGPALEWQPGQCHCAKCGNTYSRNAHGIPELLIA
jgi:SAM-dependent methyltransferase